VIPFNLEEELLVNYGNCNLCRPNRALTLYLSALGPEKPPILKRAKDTVRAALKEWRKLLNELADLKLFFKRLLGNIGERILSNDAITTITSNYTLYTIRLRVLDNI